MIIILPQWEELRRLRDPHSPADILPGLLVIYGVLKLVRGTRAAPMAAGILAFGFLYWISVTFELTTLEFVLRGGLLYIGVAIIVLFQSEIRQALIAFGNRFGVHFYGVTGANSAKGLRRIVLAASTMSTNKTGALIVIERGVGLKNVIDGGVRLDAELTYDLLVAVFNPASPLHDGAVIVKDHRIAAAACFLPLTLNPRLAKDLGTRHRLAIGITEDTDAVAIVVSEETGLISYVQGGQIKRALDATALRELIFQVLEAGSAPARRERKGAMHDTDTETTESVMPM